MESTEQFINYNETYNVNSKAIMFINDSVIIFILLKERKLIKYINMFISLLIVSKILTAVNLARTLAN